MLNVLMTNAISYFCKEWAILFKKIKTLKIFAKQFSKPVSKKLLFKNDSIFPNVTARGVYFVSQINPYSNQMVIRQPLSLPEKLVLEPQKFVGKNFTSVWLVKLKRQQVVL